MDLPFIIYKNGPSACHMIKKNVDSSSPTYQTELVIAKEPKLSNYQTKDITIEIL